MIDVAYCGYCGGKLVNGSRYNYWTMKGTGERRSSRTSMYRCQNAGQGMFDHPASQFHADRIEKVVFLCLWKCVAGLLKDEDVAGKVLENQERMKKSAEAVLQKEQEELGKLQKGIEAMESYIPAAMEGGYALTIEELAEALRRHREKEEEQKNMIHEKEEHLKKMNMTEEKWEEVKKGFLPGSRFFRG